MKMGTILANGGDAGSRRALDFYPTPPNVTVALLDFIRLQPCRIWEPACGKGHMSDVLISRGHDVTSSDISHTGYGQGGIDFLTQPADEYDAIITNPPFDRSAEFIEKALKHAGLVAMLLKSQYWHAAKRLHLFEAHPPRFVLPLTWRPDFLFDTRIDGKRAAPTMECAWTVWDQTGKGTEYAPLKRPVHMAQQDDDDEL